MGAWVECGWTPAQKDLQNFPASLLTWLLRHCTSHIIHIMENPRVFTWQDVKCSHCLPTKGTSKARTFSQAREFRWEEFQEALGRFFRNTCKKCEIHRNPSKSYSTCSMEGIARNIVNHSSTQTHTHTHAVFVLLQEFRKTTDLTLRKFTWNLSQTPHVPPVRGGHRQGAWFFELQGFRMISFDCSTDFDTPQTKNGLDVGL